MTIWQALNIRGKQNATTEKCKSRLGKYGLEIETSKSRLLEFGRYAKERRKRRGEGKPETFDFLGFTFYCGENQAGKFCVKPKDQW